MIDYLLKINNTKFNFILKGGYSIVENQDIVLNKKTMADGTERRNIAEKKKTTISVSFSRIDGETLQNYLDLIQGDFECEYWSKMERIYKTGIFRLSEQPTNSLILSKKEIYDEFTIKLESV